MKKSIFVVAIAAVVGLLAISCSSTNLEANQVGWSSYSEIIPNKDWDVVKYIKLTSTETITKGPLGLYQKTEGSRVLYSQLMDAAAEAGADDIINVRIDRRLVTASAPGFMIFNTKKNVYTYTATALAIKYKGPAITYVEAEDGASVNATKPGMFRKFSGFFSRSFGKVFKIFKKSK